MTRTFRRALAVLAIVVLVPSGALGAVLFSTFQGVLPQQEAAFSDGVLPILDGYVSAFAVPLTAPGAVAMVDCGNDPSATRIRAALDAHHMRVVAIFITHGHPDHIAGCAQFAGVPIYALAAEVDAIEGRAGFRGPIPRLMPRKDAGCRVTRALADGEDVVVDGVAFHVTAAPGHTAGSAIYRARRTVFFGDAATSKEPARLVGPPWIFSDDVQQGEASLVALAPTLLGTSDVDTFAFAHSGPLRADVALLEGLAR